MKCHPFTARPTQGLFHRQLETAPGPVQRFGAGHRITEGIVGAGKLLESGTVRPLVVKQAAPFEEQLAEVGILLAHFNGQYFGSRLVVAVGLGEAPHCGECFGSVEVELGVEQGIFDEHFHALLRSD